jgi:hypothetical protein
VSLDRLLVTVVGGLLIALDLWWFLARRGLEPHVHEHR